MRLSLTGRMSPQACFLEYQCPRSLLKESTGIRGRSRHNAAPATIANDVERYGIKIVPIDVQRSDWFSKLEELSEDGPCVRQTRTAKRVCLRPAAQSPSQPYSQAMYV